MTVTTLKTWPKMTGREEFRFLADLVLKRSAGDHTMVRLHDQHSGTTRFANNQIVQNVDTRRGSLSVTVAFGRRQGTASTTDFMAGAVQDTLSRAELIARQSPEDPEFLPAIKQPSFLDVPTTRPETATAGPARRLEYVNEAIGQCRMENLNAAGVVSSSIATIGLAASTGLFAYEARTEARFSLTVQDGEATGWASAAHRSIDHLKIQEHAQAAIAKAKRGVDPRELPPGRYRVILEPAAVAGLWTALLSTLDAKSYEKGTSPVADKLGKPIVDRRLSLKNSPLHADLFGVSFTADGLPSTESTWVDRGVLKQLSYDRFTAQAKRIDKIPTLEAPCLTAHDADVTYLRDLIRKTQRAILVTNFWYIRPVNPTDLTLTGMTRDGTFLVEQGEIVASVKNFRFHDSPLRAFNRLVACTEPAEAITSETSKLLVPAMVLDEFNFSSVTKF